MTPIKVRKLTNTEDRSKYDFLVTQVPKPLIVLNAAFAFLYFFIILTWFEKGNPILYWTLIAGEVFHVWQLTTYLFTIWDTERTVKGDPKFSEPVDVYITVAGEPADIVEETLKAALDMDYPNFKVFLLNDSYVAKKANWAEYEELAGRYGAGCITRKIAGGAKAGNINNALATTKSPFVVVFDADHIPHKDFLRKTMPYFADPKMGFVQSPQYYKNHDLNEVTRGAWDQQALFFGPICKGRNRWNTVTMCGTNMVIRKSALLEVGGMDQSIAEDFVTGAFLHSRGWKSHYVAEVLAEGLAPEDFLSYNKQQFRWARGSLDVIFKYNVLFKRGLSFAQRIQYLSSISFFVSGVVVIMNALIPVLFFYTGIVPLQISTMSLAAVFLPYIFLTLYILEVSTNYSFTFKSLAFAMAGWNIHLKALWASITGQKSGFHITPKRQQEGNFIRLVIPHITYIVVALVGFVYAAWREGINPSVITNFAWALLNIGIFAEFIRAALPAKSSEKAPAFELKPKRMGLTAAQ